MGYEEKKYTLSEIADFLKGELEGPGDLVITGVCDLADASECQISFVESKAYVDAMKRSKAGAVVVSGDITPDRPAIRVDDARIAFVKLIELFAPKGCTVEAGVHSSSVVSDSACIAESVSIGPNCVIGENVRIGANCIIYANVYIGDETVIGDDCIIWPGVVIRERIRIGNRVIIHPNATIGADGFGYYFEKGEYHKIKHIGIVVIEDDVEIGASACIDRAKAGVTKIGKGCKIDNLVQIGHNVQIGENTVIAGQAGISGSVKIGSYVIIGGQVGIADHVTIGNRVRAAAQAGITKDIPDGTDVRGYPAIDNRSWTRQYIRLKKLPDKVEEIAKRMNELEKSVYNKRGS